MRKDLYAEVTNRIIHELETGAVPWVRPWATTGKHAMPYNATTDKPYRGINVVLLGMGMMGGWDTSAFLTFKQCKDAGGMVRKGEHGRRIYFYKPLIVQDRATGKDKSIPMLKEYVVFNVAQCDGLPEEIASITAPVVPVTLDSEMDAALLATGAKIVHGGDRAFYSPGHDQITMPHAATFKDLANYRATLAHEVTHWTGDEKRCNRDLRNRFGTSAYAAEELIAELGAAFICARFGVAGDLRHAGYIETWIKLLKDDSRAIFTAASKAQQAADFILAASDAVQETTEEPLALAA